MSESLLAGGQLIWKMVAGLLSAHDKAKADLFNLHVEPLQLRIVAVHKDYMQVLRELRNNLRGGVLKMHDVVRLLESRRLDFLHERDLAKQIANQLAASERRPVRTDAWSTMLAYCNAIDRYLSSPYQFHYASAMTTLLDAAREGATIEFREELLVAASSNPDAAANTSTEFTYLLDSMLERWLPGALSEVNTCYAKLRAQLL
jgi:hypothetical protein